MAAAFAFIVIFIMAFMVFAALARWIFRVQDIVELLTEIRNELKKNHPETTTPDKETPIDQTKSFM